MISVGKLLVATSKLNDPMFSDSIIFITEYGEIGAQGIIINGRNIGFAVVGDTELPTDLDHTDEDGNLSEYAKSQMNDFMGEVMQNEDITPISFGGPCQTPIYVIHGHPDLHVSPNSKELLPGVLFALPNDVDSVLENTNEEERKLKFFMGVAGWSSGQLENELSLGAWTLHESTGLADVLWDASRLNEFVGRSSGGFLDIFKRAINSPPSWN